MNSIDKKLNKTLQEIAHQWRQPLSQINSLVLVIDAILQKNGTLTNEIEKKLLDIENLTMFMSNTIDDLSNPIQTNKDLLSLNDVIYNLKMLMENILDEKNIKLFININNTIQVKSNFGKLLQALLVIINNAKDALVERNIYDAYIDIFIEEEKDYCLIKISDNAGGITKKTMQKIFDNDFSSKHHSEGSGLGLHMTKTIIESDLSGILKVSNYNHGTCFEIKLPKTLSID